MLGLRNHSNLGRSPSRYLRPKCRIATKANLGFETLKQGLRLEMIDYLRQIVHRCTALARACSDRAVGHELGDLSVELMEKAQELESSGLH